MQNFSQAVHQLTAEGIEARYVLVTDDVASAPEVERAKRRGIAGGFAVFKVMSAAAEAGYDLAGVERIGKHANDRTRTLGVAFGGCTMPGQDEPLFTVARSHFALGLGIHGEPGISEHQLPRASQLAELLVGRLLNEVPDGASSKVTVILNGLGCTKHEELFILWGAVARLLRQLGVEVVQPEVGELVTSLDMAGCSLSLVWLDDELETLWSAPADAPAYRKGIIQESLSPRRPTGISRASREQPDSTPSDEEGRRVAATVLRALEAMAGTVAESEEELGRIDAVAGDGDHGRGMVRGTRAAVEAASSAVAAGTGPRSTVNAAAEAWAAKAGGTSGVLWGSGLTAFGNALDDVGRPSVQAVIAGVRAGYEAVTQLGGASPGDKTMLDALLPFVEVLTSAVREGETLPTAWARAADAARDAADETASLRAKAGRARSLPERSIGTPDAGAVSLAKCLTAVGQVLSQHMGERSRKQGPGPSTGTTTGQ